MNDRRPILAVVIPLWNREATIERTLQGVVVQTLANIEVIVVDDGSTDSSGKRASRTGDPRVRVVTLDSNRGPSYARNAGVEAATANLVAFLDSDDEVDPEWAEALSSPFSDASCAAVCCGYRNTRSSDAWELLPGDLGPCFDHVVGRFQAGTFALRRDVFASIGGYSENLLYGENTELGLRVVEWCSLNAKTVLSVPRVLHSWHQRPAIRNDDHLESRFEGALFTIQRHRDRLAKDPKLLASYYAVAANSAYRLGNLGQARTNFRSAVRCAPSNARYLAWYLRSVLASIRQLRGRGLPTEGRNR